MTIQPRVTGTGYYYLEYLASTPHYYIFNRVTQLHADADVGLYTEGTGNLANVKGATNPVKAVFRKNNRNTDTSSEIILSDNNYFPNPNPNAPRTTIYENNIYEWVEQVNQGLGDRYDLKVSGTIQTFSTTNTSTPQPDTLLFTLKAAILIGADIKTNSFNGKSFSELTFVADSINTAYKNNP